jgi:hypothetical protein
MVKTSSSWRDFHHEYMVFWSQYVGFGLRPKVWTRRKDAKTGSIFDINYLLMQNILCAFASSRLIILSKRQSRLHK